MHIMSTAFSNGTKIPLRYTGEGENISPPLEWSDLPNAAKTLVLLCEDPDAPHADGGRHPFVHWLVYNIPATLTHLPEAILPDEKVESPMPFCQGLNSFGNIGYGGPMPPLGDNAHRYIFRLFALDAELELHSRANKSDLLQEIGRHFLGSTECMGIYERAAGQKLAS